MATKVYSNLDKPVQIVETVRDNGDGTAVSATSTSGLDTTNSSAVALGAGAVFTGTAVDVSRYAAVNVSVFSNQASATNGLSLQQSSDGTNWDILDTYSVPASTGKTFSVQVAARFFRVVYTNGGTIQTTFRLQTLLKVGTNPVSSVKPQDLRTNENDMQETVAYASVYNGTVSDTWSRRTRIVLVSRLVSAAATTNPTSAKATPGDVWKVTGYNAAAALRYLKLYNKASAPTVGTDTPVATIALPATAAFTIDFEQMQFTAGIAYAFTTGVADADTGALTLADITAFNLFYA